MAFLKFIKNTKFTIILVLVILVAIGYVGLRWYGEKMKLVEQRLADPRFPYHEYSLLELARQGKLFDLNDEDRAKFQEELKSLPTRTTPQETFNVYVQALKDGDIEGALSCFVDRGQEQKNMENILNNYNNDRKIEDIIKMTEEIKLQIPWDKEKIEKNSTGKIGVYYSFICIYDKSAICNIGFSKDPFGDWKIANL